MELAFNEGRILITEDKTSGLRMSQRWIALESSSSDFQQQRDTRWPLP
jgi:hypothetical protein